MCDVPFHDNSPPLDVSKDQFEDFFDSNDEFSSTDDDSFSIDNIDYVEASPSDSELVSSEVMEIVIPEVGGIDDDILLTIKDDILREKLLNINLLIAKIEALNDNPTPSSNFMTKSSFTSLNSLLEETNTFDNSLPEFETFCLDVEEISSGSTTTRSDISLPEYKVFYDDHVKEISSGGITTHSNSSLYYSFIFDLLINPFPPADRSDFYEFADELIHIISPPEYDCFLFKIEPNSGDFTMDEVEDISLTREPRVHNALPTHPTLQLNLEFKPFSESLFTYYSQKDEDSCQWILYSSLHFFCLNWESRLATETEIMEQSVSAVLKNSESQFDPYSLMKEDGVTRDAKKEKPIVLTSLVVHYWVSCGCIYASRNNYICARMVEYKVTKPVHVVLKKVGLEFPQVFLDDYIDCFGAGADESDQRGWCFMFWNVKKTANAPILIALVLEKASINGLDLLLPTK
nr:lysine-specific histone demethylase 1 homolog 3 [Tanacetum cinerariifolium]